ncbi:MFS transporter [Streptomyces sp. 4N509B]|uniref:MFS transporter n=1 Tax=Streptomyces sp. 4N509B TaxID=3457413 RepID=UPI003FD5011E
MSDADVDATNTSGVTPVPSIPPSPPVPPVEAGAEADDSEGAAGGVLARPYRALTLGCVSTVLLIAFEAMAVGTAMPAAAESLDGVALYAFAFSAFFTTSLLGMAVSGQWCDRSGPLPPVVAGVVAFSGGLLLSGAAQSMWVFVAGRAVQGAAGGLVIVALYVTVRRAYPERLRPAALASFSAAWVVPSMVGPVVSGTVTERLGWRWVFLSMTVLVVLPLLVMLPALRRQAPGPTEGEDRGRLDWRRLRLALAVALGAGLLQFGGQELRWLSLLPAAVGVALLAPSALRLLPRGTFRAARGMPAAILLRGLVSCAYMVAQTFLPLLLVTERGLTPTEAGLALVASGIAWAAGAQIQSRSRFERHRYVLVVMGAVLIAVGIALLPTALAGAVPVWTPAVVLAVGALGMGLVVSSVAVVVLRLSEPSQAGNNVASLQLCDSLSNVVMLTVAGTLFAALGGDTTAAAEAGHGAGADVGAAGETATSIGAAPFTVVYALAAAVALLAVVVASRLRVASPPRQAEPR